MKNKKISKKIGKQSVLIESPVIISASGSVAGKKESEGPLAKYFDEIIIKDKEKSWEKSESKMQKKAIFKACEKAKINFEEIDYILGGDLLNQCMGSSFGLRGLEIPFFGLYGACSTIVEGLSLGAMIIDGGFAQNIISVTSSHFCTAERQYRTPLEYGGQRTPTSQWTVTGAGALLLSSESKGPLISHITTGKIIDMGVKDANNMGAAMAPAACDTIRAHFEDLGREPDFYDLILSGDLGSVGKEIVVDILKSWQINVKNNYDDSGCMIYDLKTQDVRAGGSGCGCLAITLSSILSRLKAGEINNVLVVGTGALLSLTSSLQGESIPAIAHAISITNKGDDLLCII